MQGFRYFHARNNWNFVGIVAQLFHFLLRECVSWQKQECEERRSGQDGCIVRTGHTKLLVLWRYFTCICSVNFLFVLCHLCYRVKIIYHHKNKSILSYFFTSWNWRLLTSVAGLQRKLEVWSFIATIAYKISKRQVKRISFYFETRWHFILVISQWTIIMY